MRVLSCGLHLHTDISLLLLINPVATHFAIIMSSCGSVNRPQWRLGLSDVGGYMIIVICYIIFRGVNGTWPM